MENQPCSRKERSYIKCSLPFVLSWNIMTRTEHLEDTILSTFLVRIHFEPQGCILQSARIILSRKLIGLTDMEKSSELRNLECLPTTGFYTIDEFMNRPH